MREEQADRLIANISLLCNHVFELQMSINPIANLANKILNDMKEKEDAGA